MKRIYLDFAAAAPVVPVARRAFMDALATYGNPSGMHEEGRAARELLETARRGIARLTETKAEHIIFTSGATEANLLAIRGHVNERVRRGDALGSIHLLYHPGAHASVVRVMETLKAEGVQIEEVAHTKGAVDIDGLARQIRPETSLVSLEAISPETGMRFDLRKVRTVLDAARKPGEPRVVLHVDASQLPLIESIERDRLSADLMTLDAQKIGGVRGIGCLIRSSHAPLLPVSSGGGQEGGLRSGTESPTLASAFCAALAHAAKEREVFSKGAEASRERLVQELSQSIPDLYVCGGARHAPHILTIALPGRDTDYLVALLDEAGYAVSTKSACESDGGTARMTLAETGDEALSSSTLRISWGPETPPKALILFAAALAKTVRFLDENRVS